MEGKPVGSILEHQRGQPKMAWEGFMLKRADTH